MKPVVAILGVLVSGLMASPPRVASADDGAAIPDWPAPRYWGPPAVSASQPPSHEGSRAAMSVSATPLPFVSILPCRLVDTRGNGAPLTGGFLPAATVRSYTLTGVCNVPANAQAISLNATVVKPVGPGFLTLWPQGGAFPPVSTLNYLGNDVIVNAAVVPLSATGGISIALGVSGGDVVLDTNGYYAPETTLPTTDGNTAYGWEALTSNATGTDNSAFGYWALSANSTGVYNTALGFFALGFNQTGNSNVAVGSGALFHGVAAGDNSAFGTSALYNLGAGFDNIALGENAGLSLTSGNSNIYIGADAGGSAESTTIRIGALGLQTSAYVVGIWNQASSSGVGVYVNSSGKLGTTTSSRRFKEEIVEMGAESAVLMKLRPVSFFYKPQYDDTHTRQYGLVAEEVAEVAPSLVVYDKDGQPETVRYHFVNAMLLNEVQKQRQTMDDQSRMIELQSNSLEDLRGRLEVQGRQIEALRQALESGRRSQ